MVAPLSRPSPMDGWRDCLLPGQPGTIRFAGRAGNRALRPPAARVGFEFIADAAQVFSWMAQLQGKRS